MAIIHRTTMTPGKLELLAAWLPSQPWCHGAGRAPELARAGGFRLDDPPGEVGIEFMVRIHRALRPGDTPDGALQPCLWAPWRLPAGPRRAASWPARSTGSTQPARSKPQRWAAPAG